MFVRLRDGTVVFLGKLQTTDLLFVRASALLGCTNRILIPRLAKTAPNSKFFDQLAPKISQAKAPVRVASDASRAPGRDGLLRAVPLINPKFSKNAQ
jgi:hypothetical protein